MLYPLSYGDVIGIHAQYQRRYVILKIKTARNELVTARSKELKGSDWPDVGDGLELTVEGLGTV